MSSTTILLLFTTILALSSAQDCRFRAYGPGSTLVDHKRFVSCLLDVQFNANQAKQTLQTLQRSAPLYAFIDAVKDSPENGFPRFKVDIMADLDRVAKTYYDSDADFQQDLSDIFIKLRDPHTYYQKPKECYSVFALQPLVLGSKLVNNRQIIYVEGVLGKLVNDPLYSKIPLTEFIGAEVTFIDEQPALDEILDFARLYGYISKDDGTAFNWAVANGYQQRPMSLLPTPLGPSQHIEFAYENGTYGSFHIPWGFFFTATTNYTKTGCQPTFLLEHTPKNVLEQHKLPKKFLNALGVERNDDDFDVDNGIMIIPFTDDVIVLKITSFSPDDDEKFLDVVEDLLQVSKAKNIPRLILDLRGNGGGSICLGYQVIRNLVDDRNPIGHYDIIHSPLMDLMVSRSNANTPLTGSAWWTQENGQPYPNNSWYTPGEKHIRGGVEGVYSLPSYHNCNFSSEPPVHKFAKILILSDGLCGSTCAVFTSHLSARERVETVTIGGIYNKTQQPFSFPGGQVMDYANINALARSLGLSNHPLVPQRFPNRAGFRFTWLEIYPWLASDPVNVPLEFIFFPSDHRIPMWLTDSAPASDILRLYQETAQYF